MKRQDVQIITTLISRIIRRFLMHRNPTLQMAFQTLPARPRKG